MANKQSLFHQCSNALDNTIATLFGLVFMSVGVASFVSASKVADPAWLKIILSIQMPAWAALVLITLGAYFIWPTQTKEAVEALRGVGRGGVK